MPTQDVIARSAERATRQSLCKKARFVFCSDCRIALCAPRNDRQQRGFCTLPDTWECASRKFRQIQLILWV
ncbi:MAG: hypothetical protein LBL66_10065, partial [Clostridiales bacterium]|nr:hypothetical protein [Clostridiales bacterium]